MNRRQAGYFGWCAAVALSSLVYVAPAFTTVPLLWYYPLTHAWALEGRPHGFALDWFGRTIWAVLAAAIGFSVGTILARRLSPASPRAYRLWAASAGMATLLAIAVYTYQLAHRRPVPEPLPPSYQPR